MTTIILVSALLVFGLIILKNIDFSGIGSMGKRKMQLDGWSKKNVLSEAFKEQIEDRVKVVNRLDFDLLAKQAGLRNMDFYNFNMLRIILAVLGFVLAGFFTKSAVMGGLFALLGYIMPLQILKAVANARANRLTNQLGTFMRMATERYNSTGDFKKAIIETQKDLEGQEPIYTECQITISEMNLGISPAEALRNMADRTGDKYFKRYAVYYEISADAGTLETKKALLNDAFKQYEENKEIVMDLKKATREPIATAYMMIGFVVFGVFMGAAINEGYVTFMTKTLAGKVISAILVGVILGSLWLVNTKINAPVDELISKKKRRYQR